MHPLECEVFDLCRDNGLFAPGDRLVLGVSGGSDSMALLHLLARLTPHLEISFVVAHADHGLRPLEAEYEESLVRRAAAALGVECLVSHLEVAIHAKARGASVEEVARELRYEFFDDVAASHGAAKVVVAHTADDQAEEILLRLIRGAGRQGLSGMRLLREGRIVRPFLATEKSRILLYLKEREIPFAEDSSNADRRYLRNKIRLDLLPFLAQFNPNIKQTLRQTAAILRDEDAVLADLAAKEYALLVREDESVAGRDARVGRRQFNQRPLAIRRRLIETVRNSFGAKFGFRQIDSLISLAASKGCGQLHLGRGLLALTDQEELRFLYPEGRRPGRLIKADAAPAFSVVVPQPGRYPIPEIGKEVTVEILAGSPSQEEMQSDGADFLDAEAVAFPLLVRNRLAGDRFQPVNSPGRKKVADFLSDLKMPVPQRNNLPLLLSADHIVAILGVRIDQGCKVSATTTSVLKITMNPELPK